MLLRLDDAERLARDLGYACRRARPDELTIELCPQVDLVYVNWPDQQDNMIAFQGSAWHCHDHYTAQVEEGAYVECDETEILVALSIGELLVVTMMSHGEVRARWLRHRREPLLIDSLEHGEELRVQRVSTK